MGLGVGGRGDTKPGRKGREGKMGAACLCVRFEQTVMILRAKIQGRHKHGGFCPVTSGRESGNEGSWCLSVPHWVLGSPWCHLIRFDNDGRHWYLDWIPLSLHLSLLRKDHHLFVFQSRDCEQVSQHLFKTRKMTAFLDEVRNQHSRAFRPVSVLGCCSNTATVINRMGSFLIESWDSNLGLIKQKNFYLIWVFSTFFLSLNRSFCCCCCC